MKKSLLTAFSFLLLASAFAVPQKYSLVRTTNNPFDLSVWSPANIPQSGDTINIGRGLTLTIPSDFAYANLYINVYGAIVLAGSPVNVILSNSVINVHTGATLSGSNATQQIVMGNTLFRGSDPLVVGPKLATSTSGGFKPYVEFTTLPVKFTSFNIARSNNSNIITWTTAEEILVAHYDVQRSEDGKDWKNIATLSATGTTANTYSFTDNNRTATTTYYRVREVDADGSLTFTDVRMLKGSTAANLSITAVPNRITVLFAKPVNEKVTIQVIGLNGSVAAMQTVTAPSGALQLTTSGLHGIYIVHVSNGRDLNAAQQVLL